MEMLRLREVKYLVQGHPARLRRSRDSDLDHWPSEPSPLTMLLYFLKLSSLLLLPFLVQASLSPSSPYGSGPGGDVPAGHRGEVWLSAEDASSAPGFPAGLVPEGLSAGREETC